MWALKEDTHYLHGTKYNDYKDPLLEDMPSFDILQYPSGKEHYPDEWE